MNLQLVLLDRDGVINFDSPDYIKCPEEWIALPGALQAIAQLHHTYWTGTPYPHVLARPAAAGPQAQRRHRTTGQASGRNLQTSKGTQ